MTKMNNKLSEALNTEPIEINPIIEVQSTEVTSPQSSRR
jgi:hypothetical protein